MRVIVEKDDGTTQDITSLVQIAFDVATHSMDWGSGFLDVEETDGLILLAAACGFPALEEILQEQWQARIREGKSWTELEEMARERGARSNLTMEPTPAEEVAFLHDLMRRYAPEAEQ